MTRPASLIFSRQILWLFFIFFGLRLASYWLREALFLQAVVIVVYLVVFGFLFYKNHDWAWKILLAELFLGGSGHMLELYGLSLRTITVLTFLTLWLFLGLAQRRHHHLHIPHYLFYLGIPLALIIGMATLRGIALGHGFAPVVQDALPFVYLLLALPAAHLFTRDEMREFMLRLVLIFVLGSALLALATFFLYTTQAGVLQDSFYHWFRDVAMGKITFLTPYFYRIVVPEHLLIVPLQLIILSLLIRDDKHHVLWRVFYTLGAIILALDFSRSYFLAFLIGLPCLLYRHKFLAWLREAFFALVMFTLAFTGINFVASGGQTLGLDLLGFRFLSIAAPEIETSASHRLLLLKPIRELIQVNPLIGNGLGGAIVYTDPGTLTRVSTRHFDWGYLELAAELGLPGLAWFLVLLFLLGTEIIKKIRGTPDFPDFAIGLLAALISLVVMTATTPALYHVFGMFMLSLIFAFVTRPAGLGATLHSLKRRLFGEPELPG